jgi:hypothetical protein
VSGAGEYNHTERSIQTGHCRSFSMTVELVNRGAICCSALRPFEIRGANAVAYLLGAWRCLHCRCECKCLFSAEYSWASGDKGPFQAHSVARRLENRYGGRTKSDWSHRAKVDKRSAFTEGSTASEGALQRSSWCDHFIHVVAVSLIDQSSQHNPRPASYESSSEVRNGDIPPSIIPTRFPLLRACMSHSTAAERMSFET